MIVTTYFNGRPFGSPMNDLRDDDLLWYIKTQVELGRTVTIEPEQDS